MKKLVLLTYDDDSPSFRHRIKSILPLVESAGWCHEIVVIPSGRYVVRILKILGKVASADVILMAKLKLSPIEAMLLKKYGRKIIYDFDDAIYYRRPKKLFAEPDRSRWRMAKFASMCRIADLVVAGNRVLKKKALEYSDNVTVLPTPVNGRTYARKSTPSSSVVVWIGLPENLVYLELIQPALERLAKEYGNFRLRVVSLRVPDLGDVPIEFVEWSPETEVSALLSADVGIMPLSDDDWARGKCAFKLLQYMAAGLPCVASPVGANNEVVQHGKSGFLADSNDKWHQSLKKLFDNHELARQFGTVGREIVEQNYDYGVLAGKWLKIVTNLNGDELMP
jgi:glycosyltransferase involved in cell wall biosynthesis